MLGRVIPIAAFLVAACGSGDTQAPVEADRAEPVAPPPAAAEAAAIPAPFLGVYDVSLKACGRPGDGRLTVSPGELRFHESIGIVRKVETAGAATLKVEADYQGEGESWRNVRELRLGEGGSSLTVSGEGTRLERVRCPEGAR